MKHYGLTLLFIGLSLGLGPDAWAAKTATISFDEAPLFEKPDKTSKVLERLRTGAIITTANDPKDGFYRSRAASGATGYIPAEMVNFYAASERTQRGATKKTGLTKVSFGLFGGLSLFSLSDANALIGFDGLKNGLSFGGELGFWPTRYLGFILRTEYLSKSVAATETTSAVEYSFGAQSLPVYLGINLRFLNEKKVSASLSLLPGYTLSNDLSGTASSLTAPNVTTFSAKSVTFLGKIDFWRILSQRFFLFAEGGYRYSKSAAITPTTIGAGSTVFQSGGIYTPVSLNFSGPFGDGGVGLRF
ncbi:outer membrane beta-barrel protein [Bdellovibrionota bacterium FG-2]